MFTLQYAKDPVFISESGDAINLTVKWEEFGEEHPFTATSYDSMEHGRNLHALALAGHFGVVGDYVPPPVNADGQATQPQPISVGAQQF